MTGWTGHCLCGATRFECDEGKIRWQGVCHCESCRRAASAPMVAWFGVGDAHWRWTGAAPVTYASSPGVERGFCGACGSPMFYRSVRWPDETHFYAPSLDRPEDYRPTFHTNCREMLSWVKLDDGLPRHDAPSG